jgi:CBS domain-containing protein
MQKTVATILEGKGGEVLRIGPDATVFEALELMAEKGIGALVVTDGDHLAGILSERDYARKVILLDRGSRETKVSEIMTSEVVTVEPGRTVTECMELMTERRFRHLPVVSDGQLIGVISIGDVVKAVISEQRQLIQELEQYITS